LSDVYRFELFHTLKYDNYSCNYKEFSYAMVAKSSKRPRGRPKGFIPDEALDRAVEMFWEYGYEGVDVDRIARAVNVTKPALYRAFGDKPTLLLKAVERYAMTYIAPRVAAFQAEPDIHKAVTAFCEATVNTVSGDVRGGCMMAAAAMGQSERVTEIRSWTAQGLTASADIFAKRFEQEMKAGRLTRTPSAKVRGRALVDLLQGLQLRAKTGIAREKLLKDARSYVPLILGE
jgi:AcrR family transcriptional regulator